MDNHIKIGFLVSYDFKYLYNSIPLVYEEADAIYLAIDKNGKTWSGDEFIIPGEFFDWLSAIDVNSKIVVYRDDFYNCEFSPMENDTRERNMLGEFMGKGGWHIQIDADEYFINFSGFRKFLIGEIDKYVDDVLSPVCVYVKVLTIYKQLEDGYLLIESDEYLPIATKFPRYVYARNTDGDKILVNYKMVHQSWGRNEEELLTKLKSWSHKDDFKVDSYFKLWQACDKYNFKYYNNFHPIEPTMWSKLIYVNSKDLKSLIDEFASNETEIKIKYHPIPKLDENKNISKNKWFSIFKKK